MSAETSIQHSDIGESGKAPVFDFPEGGQKTEPSISNSNADIFEMPTAIQEAANEVVTEEDKLVHEVACVWRQSITHSSVKVSTTNKLNHNQINHCLVLLKPILASKLHLELDYAKHLFVNLNEPEEVTKLSEVIHAVLTAGFDDKNPDKTSKDKLDCLRDHVSELAAKVLVPTDVHSGVANVWRYVANRRKDIEEGRFDFRKLQGVYPYELTGNPYREVNRALGGTAVKDAAS